MLLRSKLSPSIDTKSPFKAVLIITIHPRQTCPNPNQLRPRLTGFCESSSTSLSGTDERRREKTESTMWLLCRWSFGALFFFSLLSSLSACWVQGSSPFGELTSISLQNLSGWWSHRSSSPPSLRGAEDPASRCYWTELTTRSLLKPLRWPEYLTTLIIRCKSETLNTSEALT